MKLATIKKHIKTLPDAQINPLVEWLTQYRDCEVWPREMTADIQLLGIDKWKEALTQAMEKAPQRDQAALRLLNSMKCSTEADRDQVLRDVECLLAEPLSEAGKRGTRGKSTNN